MYYNYYQKTTLSIHADLITKIQETSEHTGLSCNQIIVFCLRKYAKKIRISLKLNRLCMYQPRCRLYKAFPVRLPQALYEKGFDLRKAQKLSLSFIFALAFMRYLDEISKTPELVLSCSAGYSNSEKTYQGSHFVQNGRHVFTYYWDKPPD